MVLAAAFRERSLAGPGLAFCNGGCGKGRRCLKTLIFATSGWRGRSLVGSGAVVRRLLARGGSNSLVATGGLPAQAQGIGCTRIQAAISSYGNETESLFDAFLD